MGHHEEDDTYVKVNKWPKEKIAAFYRFMNLQYAYAPTCLNVIDFAGELGVASTPETVLFVDVGGGIGAMCDDIRKKYPDLQGSIILQRPGTGRSSCVGRRYN
jgi:hypothetical protein